MGVPQLYVFGLELTVHIKEFYKTTPIRFYSALPLLMTIHTCF